MNCNAQLISLRIMPWLSFLLCHWDIWSRWIPRVSLHYLWQIFSIGLVTEWSICFLCRCQLHLDHCKDTIYLILFFILPIVSDNSVFCAHQTAGHWPNWWRLPPSYCFSFWDFPWFKNQELCSTPSIQRVESRVIRLHRKAFGRPLLVETLLHVFDTPNRLFFQYFRYCSTPSIQFLDTPNGLSYISTSFPLFLLPFSFSLLYLEIFF